MAHHHRVPEPSQAQGKDSAELKVQSATDEMLTGNHPSHEVGKVKQVATPQEKGQGFFDYEIAGFPWAFFLVLSVIALGVLGILLKLVGLY